jgi:hypothetical protein
MEARTFFPGTSRKCVLGPITLQKDRKIKCVGIRMILTGESMQSMPDWLGEAYTAVAKQFTEVEPTIQQISDLPITLANHPPGQRPSTELFEGPSALAPNSELRKLIVLRTGESNDPEVTLQFNLYCPFSRELWRWLGEMGGSEIHMTFPSGRGPVEVVAPPAQNEFIAERPELAPEHDEEFATAAPGTKPPKGKLVN